MNRTEKDVEGDSGRHSRHDGKSRVCPFTARREVDRMLSENPHLTEPVREFLDDEATAWRHTKPDYNIVNLEFLKGKTKCHVKGSLEMIVENAVKTWEMEASHKVVTGDWKTIVHHQYSVQANGGRVFGLDEAAERGNYNVLMDNVDKKLYNAENEDFESSHELFVNAFEMSFPWELLEVFVGPPRIVFSWRHWGSFTGIYKGNKGNGEQLEMKGFAIVTVTENLKITAIEVFYNPSEFLTNLRGETFEENSLMGNKAMIENLLKTFHIDLEMERENVIAADCAFESNGKSITPPFDSCYTDWKIEDVFIADESRLAFSWRIQTSQHGLAIIELNARKQIQSFEVFFKP